MDIWEIIYFNCRERYEFYGIIAVIHNLSSCEIKAWKKNSGLNEIGTHDLCTGIAEVMGLNPV